VNHDMQAVDLEPGEVADDPREEWWAHIAQGISELSEANETPSGVSTPTSMFAPSDVDFRTDAWMAQLAQVQGWLNMPHLPLTNRESFLNALVSALELEPDEALSLGDGAIELSVTGLESLSQRVEQAVRRQQEFTANMESDGITRAVASDVWAAAWEDVDTDVEQISSKPVVAQAEVMPISELTDSELNLTPSYQRGDVWTSTDRQALIESVLRGIPLPSIILLETGPATPREVVDGKQRLTALLRFVGRHPVAVSKVEEAQTRHPGHDLMALFRTDYPKFRRTWKMLENESLTAAREDEYYFPFKLRNNGKGGLVGEKLEPLQGKYYTQIVNQIINVAGVDIPVQRLFTKTVAYKVPVILYTQADPAQIHDVFKLYNKQGVHLNAEEIRNAAYHELDLVRAVLVAAGDADGRQDIADIAPAVAGVVGIEQLGKTLADYNFGTARYRRMKVLFWTVSLLLMDTHGDKLKSTAGHINQLLDRVTADGVDPLRNQMTLADLFAWLVESINLHASRDDLWSATFMDGGEGVKWQELQLVGSLVGIALAKAVAPDNLADRLDEHAEEILDASERLWKREFNAQTKSQLDYIARIARGILQILELDPADASEAVRERFGTSGYESLINMILPEPSPKP
jgi:hypothetical protein